MNKMMKRRPLFWVVTTVFIIFALLLAAVFINLPKPQRVSDSSYDLNLLSDGIYEGECDNGLVFVKLEVNVQNHEISNVKILEHDNGMGQPAEAIINNVINSQSIEVDAVSGATFSSQTILKAIENALSK